MTIELRADRAAMRVGGPDAEKLLHDVLTAPIKAEEGPAVWWALLSPQGKIQAEGLIGYADGAFWLDVPMQVMEAFSKRMRMYKLRANAELEDLRTTHRVGWSADRPNMGVVHADGRCETMGFRVIAPVADAETWQPGDGYTLARIGAGISEIDGDIAPDSQFPHDLGMDLLGGIDFKKGCYVGQEVVSRMQHRGTARRRPILVEGTDLASGDELSFNGRTVGEVGHVHGGRGVAIVRLDRVTDPQAVVSSAGPVSLALPKWASYGLGEGAAAADSDRAGPSAN